MGTMADYNLAQMLPEVMHGWRDILGCRWCGRETEHPIVGHDGYCPIPTLFQLKSLVDQALDVAYKYGSVDGSHHKMWVIDQMVRALTSDGYSEWVIKACAGEDGEPSAYEWDVGIAP